MPGDAKTAGKGNSRFTFAAWLPVCIFFLIFAIRADATQAITYWPAWLWATPPVTLLLVMSLARRRIFWKHIAAWLLFAIAFFDSPLSLVRFPYTLPPKTGLRIVSLNCAVGNPGAAAEAIATGADVILFQESPGEADIRALLSKGFNLVWGRDCSIATRWPLFKSQSKDLDSTSADWELETDDHVAVTSLRLAPPIMRLDYLLPSTWSEYALDRRNRREELAKIMGSAFKSPLAIVGGDFNSGPDDGIEHPTLDGFTDAFAAAGHGWGGTGTNEFPFVRVDQIWLKGFRILRAFSVATKNSDHRMVVVDVEAP